MNMLVSHEKAKEIYFIKCWNNIWKMCEAKTTTQLKVNARISLYHEHDPQCTEDTCFDGGFPVGRNTVWPVFYLTRSTRGLPRCSTAQAQQRADIRCAGKATCWLHSWLHGRFAFLWPVALQDPSQHLPVP